MSDYRGLVFPSEVAAQRAVAKGDFLLAVERATDRLSDAELAHCLNRDNHERWWPNPHRDQKGAAA